MRGPFAKWRPEPIDRSAPRGGLTRTPLCRDGVDVILNYRVIKICNLFILKYKNLDRQYVQIHSVKKYSIRF